MFVSDTIAVNEMKSNHCLMIRLTLHKKNKFTHNLSSFKKLHSTSGCFWTSTDSQQSLLQIVEKFNFPSAYVKTRYICKCKLQKCRQININRPNVHQNKYAEEEKRWCKVCKGNLVSVQCRLSSITVCVWRRSEVRVCSAGSAAAPWTDGHVPQRPSGFAAVAKDKMLRIKLAQTN